MTSQKIAGKGLRRRRKERGRGRDGVVRKLRGFRCARPKIRQEMRGENEKKKKEKELSAKIVVRRHNHTAWDDERGN